MPDPLDDSDGNKVPAPQLSPEALQLGVKPDQKATLNLPAGYWAASLKPGEFAIRSGVVEQNLATGAQRPHIVAGLALEEQPQFDITPAADATAQQLLDQRLKTSAWAAGVYGKDLPPAQRTELGNAYATATTQAAAIGSKTATFKTPADFEQGRAAMAKVMTDLVTAEQRIFSSGSAATWLKRFNRPAPSVLRPVDQNVLAKKYSAFIAGDYIAATRLQPVANTMRSASFANVIAANTLVRNWLNTHYTFEYQNDPTFPPEIVSYHGRVYRAEHDAENMDWDHWGIPGIVHTSIVGGIWALTKRRRSVKRTTTSPSGTRVDHWTEYVWTDEFLGWRVGCGAASTYEPTDRLILVTRWTDPSYAEVDQALHGLTPHIAANGDQKWFRIRGASYSVGNYGLHWVCHQTANAFTFHKWGLTPIAYDVSHALYGWYGLQGISPRKDWLDVTRFGCVPGVECYYNVTPPYSIPDPITVAAMERGMSGAGDGLDATWDPVWGWRDSSASFDRVAVNVVPPPNEEVKTEAITLVPQQLPPIAVHV